MLIPSGESSLSQLCVRWRLLIHSFDIGSTPTYLTLPRKKMQALPSSVNPWKWLGRGRVYTGEKAKYIWRTCLCPSLPPSETTLSSSVTLGKWFKSTHSTALPWNFSDWRNVLDRSMLPTTKRQGHMWLWSTYPWPCKEELSVSLI